MPGHRSETVGTVPTVSRRGAAARRQATQRLRAREHLFLGDRQELARGRRELRAAAPSERERVVDRLRERRPADVLWQPVAEVPEQAVGDHGVAMAERDEIQRGLDVLDVDLRFDRDALAL